MRKLPRLRVKRAPPWQKKRLARWLAQWTISKRLPGGNPRKVSNRRTGTLRGRSPAPAISTPRARAVGKTTEVREGQIRLLDPHVAAARDRLLYLAILKEES